MAEAVVAGGPRKQRTVLLYGESGDGKTAQVGEMAEWIYRPERKRTRLALSDRGGLETIRPYIDLGIVEVVELADNDPWVWLNKVVRGYTKISGKWVLDAKANANIGLWAFEGLTSIADALMQNLAKQAADGKNIGGGGNINFSITADGETVKVGGNNQAHYGVVQTRIVEEMWQSQKLDGWVMWTAALKRDDDQNSSGRVLGPSVCGKALTGELPRFCVYTFRIAATPGALGQPTKHVLHLGDHLDMNAGNAKGLGNSRIPLDAPRIPTQIEPASIVKAIQMIQAAGPQATEIIKKRMGL